MTTFKYSLFQRIFFYMGNTESYRERYDKRRAKQAEEFRKFTAADRAREDIEKLQSGYAHDVEYRQEFAKELSRLELQRDNNPEYGGSPDLRAEIKQALFDMRDSFNHPEEPKRRSIWTET
jgi:hypothetical protein